MTGPARRARTPQRPGVVLPWRPLNLWLRVTAVGVLLGPAGVIVGGLLLWGLWVVLDEASAAHMTFGAHL